MARFDPANIFQQFGRVRRFRGEVTGLPAWARGILYLLAIPGILLAALSILLFVVSILALLLLILPAYWMLRRVAGTRVEEQEIVAEQGLAGDAGRKRVQATVIDPPE